MNVLFLILMVFIAKSATAMDSKKKKSKYLFNGQDIMTTTMTNLKTNELIELLCHPKPIVSLIQPISHELNRRVFQLDVEERFKEYVEFFLIIYQKFLETDQKIPESVKERLSEPLRIKIQREVDRAGDGVDAFDLSHVPSVRGDILEALAHFKKHIYIPSIATAVDLRVSGLKKLFLKFREDTNVTTLDLDVNSFEALDDKTFGQYFDETAGCQHLTNLSLSYNSIKNVDFNELKILMPNIQELKFANNESLESVKNIPSTIDVIDITQTKITKHTQLTFRHANGNMLTRIVCSPSFVAEAKKVFEDLYGQRIDHFDVGEQNGGRKKEVDVMLLPPGEIKTKGCCSVM